ncbi:MAG: hypothetical protein H6936_09120 [Burkholderiales bacterium]|nr:hypothetical protein [Nitrosomonas sp.]MCP5274994.1 hypothetical protein [Burkholderiales bacterium]
MDQQNESENTRNRNENLIDIRFLIVTKAFDLVNRLVSAIIYISLGYFAYLSIESLAGKTTLTNIFVSYFSAKESDYGLPWVFAFFMFIWAILERKLRKKKTNSLQGRIKELEKIIDPNRTSSGLMTTGDTTPNDNKI